MAKNKKAKAAPKKVEQKTKLERPNFTKIALEYRKNESKILLDKVRKLGYLKNKPKPKEEDEQD